MTAARAVACAVQGVSLVVVVALMPVGAGAERGRSLATGRRLLFSSLASGPMTRWLWRYRSGSLHAAFIL